MMKSKYNNVKTTYNGIEYHSKREAAYAQKLDMLTKAVGRERVIKYERQVVSNRNSGKKDLQILTRFSSNVQR